MMKVIGEQNWNAAITSTSDMIRRCEFANGY